MRTVLTAYYSSFPSRRFQRYNLRQVLLGDVLIIIADTLLVESNWTNSVATICIRKTRFVEDTDKDPQESSLCASTGECLKFLKSSDVSAKSIRVHLDESEAVGEE